MDIKHISVVALDEVINGWKLKVTEAEEALQKINAAQELIQEPAIEKHLSRISDQVLVRQNCIIELQRKIILEREKVLEVKRQKGTR